jgi:hypothetical protein
MAEIQDLVQADLKNTQNSDTKLTSFSVEASGDKLVITTDFTGYILGSQVSGTARVIGKPGYGAVRSHMLLNIVQASFVEVKMVGGANIPTKSDDIKGFEKKLGVALDNAFKSINAVVLHPADLQGSWLNKAEVKNGEVRIWWSKSQTIIVTIVVIIAIILLLSLLYACPECFFFWAIMLQ